MNIEDTNKSKNERLEMLEFLNQLKDDSVDEDRKKMIRKIESYINEKKYGLIWEKHLEQVDTDLIKNVPIFNEITEKKINNGNDENEDYNFLLVGDNLHSLYLLEKTHSEKVDMIFIDPPYNTEEEGFYYNDSYVGRDDGFRHSKWLSMMSRRLELAYKLLKPTGFIFVSIDDNESAPLKMLMDEIFVNCYQKTDYIQVRYPDKTLTQDMTYHKQIEQVLIYSKRPFTKPRQHVEDYVFDSFKYEIKELDKPIKEIKLGNKKVHVFKSESVEIIKNDNGSKDGLKEIWASGSILNKNSSGRFARDYLTGRLEEDGLGVVYKVFEMGDDQFDYRYFKGPSRKNATRLKYYQGVPNDKLDGNGVQVKPIENFYNMAGDYGNIRHEGNIEFNGGKKPLKLIDMYLDYFHDNDITVLDFFAGSGTTGHAVIRKNSLDEGSRKFIMCTNNENNIAYGKNYQRMINISSEFDFNLKVYETALIPKIQADDELLEEELIDNVKELIELENHVEINTSDCRVIFTEESWDELFQSNDIELVTKIYTPKNISLFATPEQKEILNEYGIKVYPIPEYYFNQELREVGEY